MSDEVVIRPLAFGSARPPTAIEFGARRGLAVDPCSSLPHLCGKLNFRAAGEPPLLVCSCGAPTVQPLRLPTDVPRWVGESW